MSTRRCLLKANNYGNSMINGMESLLTTESFVDVTISCDEQMINAHRLVLSACSPYFHSMFLQHPHPHPILIITDLSYPDVKGVIDFMYHGELGALQEQLPTILRAAVTLKVKGLVELITDFLEKPVVQPAASSSHEDSNIPPNLSIYSPQPNQQPRREESPHMHGGHNRSQLQDRLQDSSFIRDNDVPSRPRSNVDNGLEPQTSTPVRPRRFFGPIDFKSSLLAFGEESSINTMLQQPSPNPVGVDHSSTSDDFRLYISSSVEATNVETTRQQQSPNPARRSSRSDDLKVSTLALIEAIKSNDMPAGQISHTSERLEHTSVSAAVQPGDVLSTNINTAATSGVTLSHRGQKVDTFSSTVDRVR